MAVTRDPDRSLRVAAAFVVALGLAYVLFLVGFAAWAAWRVLGGWAVVAVPCALLAFILAWRAFYLGMGKRALP